jgi:hypothetical protein
MLRLACVQAGAQQHIMDSPLEVPRELAGAPGQALHCGTMLLSPGVPGSVWLRSYTASIDASLDAFTNAIKEASMDA